MSWYAEALNGWHGEVVMNELQRQRLSMTGTPSWQLSDDMKELAAHAEAKAVAEIILETFDAGFWKHGTLIPRWSMINKRIGLIGSMIRLNVLRVRKNQAGTGSYYIPTPYTRPWSLHAVYIARKPDVPDPQ